MSQWHKSSHQVNLFVKYHVSDQFENADIDFKMKEEIAYEQDARSLSHSLVSGSNR